ncbi:hypothetical protein PENSTE_c011G05069 [Penicillium steckii]|uniref:Uncharacterized protein n=1 Tax=Penicillium steckii TaxID=303698 RepID=A0A1V6T704_9EURO|nr:hypothetical protein PENSTE_c011G05069 [Penicillium steckii]
MLVDKRFLIAKTIEPGPVLGQVGDKESPIINALKEAAFNIRVELQDGNICQAQMISPRSPEMDLEDLEVFLIETWPDGESYQGNQIPSTEFLLDVEQ